MLSESSNMFATEKKLKNKGEFNLKRDFIKLEQLPWVA